MTKTWLLGAVGDVFLDRPFPSTAFDLVKTVFDDIDLLFGNCEGVYTDTPSSVPSAGGFRLISARTNVESLGRAGFDVLSCANNHIVDAGHEGLFDTLRALQEQGIRAPGAGENLAAARRPAVVDHAGLRIAFLAFTAVYPGGYEARELSPGVAAMRAHTHYFVHPDAFGRVEPGADPSICTFPFPEDIRVLSELIAEVRTRADVVIVSFHWGKSTQPAHLMDYELAYGHLAIDAGADVVLGHHHHLLRGIEVYRQKPIFYGLGHFAFDMPGLEAKLGPARIEKLRRFGPYAIYPRHGYPLLPFHEDSRMTMIGLCWFHGASVVQWGLLPCQINPANQPVPVEVDRPNGRTIQLYMQSISDQAGLTTTYDQVGPVLGGYRTLLVDERRAHTLRA
jgi:Bacterial capsule synthesis protein PGA_cap